MFLERYFPSGFFTGGYFPKVTGLTPPGIIRVVIAGAEVTDLLWYGSTTNWNHIRGTRGTASVPFIIDPDTVFAPEVGQRIQIYDRLVHRVFSGTIDAVNVAWLGDDGWRVFTVTAVSLEELFDTANLDKVKYTQVTCGFMVADLLARSGVAIASGTISDGPIVQSLEVSNVAQGYATAALLAGFVWYVDPETETLMFHSPTLLATDFTLESNDVLWETIDWRQSREDFRTGQVVQLPGVSMQPVSAVFTGDDATTSFNLPTIPEYIISMVLSIGSTGRTLNWIQGTTQITVTPALPTGATVTVRYSDEGLEAATGPTSDIANRSLLYTKTRSFTPEGGLQEATALLARYSMLPAELTLSTYKPGLYVGRTLDILLEDPANSADRLNGTWVIKEIDGAIVPGIDQRPEPMGHFRYTARLVNTAATAVFQGDGSTTDFQLPVIPTDVPRVRLPDGFEGEWEIGTTHYSIVPAMTTQDSAGVDYIDPGGPPNPPSFVDTWEQLSNSDTSPPVVLGGDPPGLFPEEDTDQSVFIRTLTLYDLTVGDDIAPHTLVYADGTALRLLAVLRKDMSADLTVRINKGPQFGIVELITVTIPAAAVIDEVFEWSLASGSPAVLGPFFDKEVLTADILESDGSTDSNGVVQFTVEWVK